MKRLIILVLILGIIFTFGRAAAAENRCTFKLGFATLHSLMPDLVGNCVENEWHKPNGDGLQRTTGGLLFWRKADNFTAFTDGHRTWINGPHGLQKRFNTERFQWEALEQLRNAEFRFKMSTTKAPIRLANGKYESHEQHVWAGLVEDNVAVGDLNGDAIPDAVAIAYINFGGSGTFVHLIPFLDRDGLLVQAGEELLGDRVRVQSVSISEATVAVDMVAHGPKDPMCCPTERTVKTFKAADLLATVGPAAIEVSHISVDPQALSPSWLANLFRTMPYDASQPPGPKGLPKHIQITFGAVEPKDRGPYDPVMYIIPVVAYEQLWEEQGNKGVANMLDKVDLQVRLLPSPPPISGLPALPYEEIAGVNDLAVQVGRASTTEKSASKNGFRYVGRFAQDPNPVSKERLRYIYLGFTNDGQYLVAFFYPVTTPALPAIQDVPADEFDRVVMDHKAYMQEKAEMLNKLSSSDWQPDLARLDALVASLEIKGMPSSGIMDAVWQWERTVYHDQETPVADSERYTVTFRGDGTLSFKADCNRGFGPYTVTGGMAGTLRMGPLAMTRAECEPSSRYMDLVNALEALQNYELREAGHVLALKWPAAGPVELFRKVGAVTQP